jgi:hypothetical protein
MNTEDLNTVLDTIAGILLRCFVLSIVFVLVWLVIYLVIRNFAYSIHAKLFQITRQDFELMCYYGIAYVKVCAFVFFLFPYIAIKLAVMGKK